MPELVTLEAAKWQCRLALADTSRDDELASHLTDATGVILDYLKDRADPAWDLDTVPIPVARAIKLLTAEYWEHRGDDLRPQDTDLGCWEAIERLLARLRDPALA